MKVNVVPIIVSVVSVLILAGGVYYLISNKNTTPVDNDINLVEEQEEMNTVQDFDEFTFNTITPGTGAEAVLGNKVSVHYEGTLIDGTKFDSSYDRKEPLETQIGVGQVIEGWDKGVVGMKVGGKRKLTIPSGLGYGERGSGASIPPNADLIFEVELLKIN